MRADPTTPVTRLSDDINVRTHTPNHGHDCFLTDRWWCRQNINPANGGVDPLLLLSCAALPMGKNGCLLHARLRYFDPVRQGWSIRLIRGVSAPRFWPFFAHFPPSLARSLRLGARKPDSAKRRRNNGGKGAKSGVETAVYDPSIRMLQPCFRQAAGRRGEWGEARPLT